MSYFVQLSALSVLRSTKTWKSGFPPVLPIFRSRSFLCVAKRFSVNFPPIPQIFCVFLNREDIGQRQPISLITPPARSYRFSMRASSPALHDAAFIRCLSAAALICLKLFNVCANKINSYCVRANQFCDINATRDLISSKLRSVLLNSMNNFFNFFLRASAQQCTYLSVHHTSTTLLQLPIHQYTWVRKFHCTSKNSDYSVCHQICFFSASLCMTVHKVFGTVFLNRAHLSFTSCNILMIFLIRRFENPCL